MHNEPFSPSIKGILFNLLKTALLILKSFIMNGGGSSFDFVVVDGLLDKVLSLWLKCEQRYSSYDRAVFFKCYKKPDTVQKRSNFHIFSFFEFSKNTNLGQKIKTDQGTHSSYNWIDLLKQ